MKSLYSNILYLFLILSSCSNSDNKGMLNNSKPSSKDETKEASEDNDKSHPNFSSCEEAVEYVTKTITDEKGKLDLSKFFDKFPDKPLVKHNPNCSMLHPNSINISPPPRCNCKYYLVFGKSKNDDPNTDISCGFCNKKLKKRLRCSRCRSIYYCNTTCQRSHWKQHKKTCKK